MSWMRLAAVAIALLVMPSDLQAGGGPENLLLVVNQNSQNSLTIANYYVRLRDIPPSNVVYLDWHGGAGNTPSTRFRDEILKPVLDTIDRRGLAAQIEYIVYSSDFPFRVDFREQFKGQQASKQFGFLASITGATYLWTYVIQENPALVMPTVNWYCPPEARSNSGACRNLTGIETRGFRAGQYWTEDGPSTDDRTKGQAYFLSSMLGVTLGRGNTVEEVRDYLARASTIDGGQPDGTFYFMRNSDVRSKVRDSCYPGVVAQLQQLGAKAVIQEGEVPSGSGQALGIMTGTSSFSLGSASPSIAPGAICEHFTSLGGQFSTMAQTKLTAWLRAGAAGSTGTVAEPYAIQAKFPLPNVHLHYRRGATLGEAVYQSVSGPYQLLVVGDPLCRPWDTPPEVELEGIADDDVVSTTLAIKTQATAPPGLQLGKAEFYVDGRLLLRFPPQLPLPLKPESLAAGHHQLRVVVATDDEMAFRGRKSASFRIAEAPDAEDLLTIEVESGPMVSAGSQLQLNVAGPESASGIDILQNHRRVGHVQGSSGRVAIDTKLLGSGPVRLVAQVADADADQVALPQQSTRSRSVWILVQ